MFKRLPTFVKVWFLLDLAIALLPPLHWLASGSDSVFGVPRSLAYVYGLAIFVASSVVVAYFADRREA